MYLYYIVTKNDCFTRGDPVESYVKSVSKAKTTWVKITLKNPHRRFDQAGNSRPTSQSAQHSQFFLRGQNNGGFFGWAPGEIVGWYLGTML